MVNVVAKLIGKMVGQPMDMRLWLKFDSENIAVNSAAQKNAIRVVGKPRRMPPGRGIHLNWGAFFDVG